MTPKNPKQGKPAAPVMPPFRPPPIAEPMAEKRKRQPGDPDWQERDRSQRNRIVEGIEIVKTTMTSLQATGAVPPVTGIVIQGVLNGATLFVNRFWKK